jgi:hypothetical protein
MEKVMVKLREEYAVTYLIDLSCWAPFQAMNFRFVPASLQPIAVNSFSTLWYVDGLI